MSKNKLSRRDFLRMGAITTAGLAISAAAVACAPVAQQGGGSNAPAPTKNLNFWMWNTFAPEADEVMQTKLNEWAKANNVTIQISRDADSNMQTKIMPAIEAGTLPDVMFVDAGNALRMADAQSLDPLTDLFPEIGSAHGGWQQRLDKYVTRNNVVSFLPYSIDTPMLHFRQDIIEKAGIKVPEGQWTWEQTRDIALQASKYTEEQGKKLVGWGFGIVKQTHDGWCDDMFRNFGADIWDETGQKIILKDKSAAEATRALNFAKDAFDKGLFPADAAAYDYAANNKAYLEEQAILVINAASIYVTASQNKPALAEATGLAPKPKDKRDTTDAGLRYTLVMAKESKNKQTGTDLIKALYTSDIYAAWLEKGFVSNVLKEYDKLPMWKGKRAAFNLAAQIGTYGGYPAPYDNAAMAEVNGPDAPIGSMMVRTLIDGWTPDKAIDEADTFAKQVFAKYFK